MSNDTVFEVLSLGAGVQSTTVLLMSCRGELPKLDFAVFADTGWEPAAVYAHLDWLQAEAARHGIPVVRVSAGNIRDDALRSQVRGVAADGGRWASMPYFTRDPDGSGGMIRRQCTSEYKIAPIERYLRRGILGLRPRQRAPREVVVRQWYGISVDEAQRARLSPHAWLENYYPLILDKRMNRHECRRWLERNYPDASCRARPVRAARTDPMPSGATCATIRRRSGGRSWSLTRRSATAEVCAARSTCTPTACRSPKPTSRAPIRTRSTGCRSVPACVMYDV